MASQSSCLNTPPPIKPEDKDAIFWEDELQLDPFTQQLSVEENMLTMDIPLSSTPNQPLQDLDLDLFTDQPSTSTKHSQDCEDIRLQETANPRKKMNQTIQSAHTNTSIVNINENHLYTKPPGCQVKHFKYIGVDKVISLITIVFQKQFYIPLYHRYYKETC